MLAGRAKKNEGSTVKTSDEHRQKPPGQVESKQLRVKDVPGLVLAPRLAALGYRALGYRALGYHVHGTEGPTHAQSSS